MFWHFSIFKEIMHSYLIKNFQRSFPLESTSSFFLNFISPIRVIVIFLWRYSGAFKKALLKFMSFITRKSAPILFFSFAMGEEHSDVENIWLQSNSYIKATQENLKMWPLQAVALYIQVKIICSINWWGVWDCPL